MVAAVEISNVSKSYGNVQVLINTSLAVEEGTTLGLIGPSGAGKSTLLRCINHLETIDSGTIKVNGEMVGYRREGNRLFELGHSEIGRTFSKSTPSWPAETSASTRGTEWATLSKLLKNKSGMNYGRYYGSLFRTSTD